MSDILLAVFSILGIAIFSIGIMFVMKKAEYIFIFTSERTLRGVWAIVDKTKNGKIQIGKGRYLTQNTKPFLLKHPLLGHIPAYFFTENNPEPMDLTRHFPRSKLTATAISQMGKMSALEKLMSDMKQDMRMAVIYMLCGLLMGVTLAFTLMFFGVIDIPVGVCTSNPEVVATIVNSTRYVAV